MEKELVSKKFYDNIDSEPLLSKEDAEKNLS